VKANKTLLGRLNKQRRMPIHKSLQDIVWPIEQADMTIYDKTLLAV
jgi:hypothetical protein